MASTVRFPDVPISGGATFLPADGTTIKDVITAGTKGARIEHIRATSTDTASRVIALYRQKPSGPDIFIGAVQLLAASTTSPANVDVLAVLYVYPEKQYIELSAGEKIRANVTQAVAANQIYIMVDGNDF